MDQTADVVIVGGGVIGLASAYALACDGLRVRVLDRRAPGREASWAGAGLIAPEAETPGPSPMVQLRSRSARLYPLWVDQLRSLTGVDVGYRKCGGVDVAFTPAEDDELRSAAGVWRSQGVAHERLAAADVTRIEPALSPELQAVYYLPDRAQVRNPWLIRALIAAITHKGGSIHAGAAVEDFELERGRVVAVRSSAGRFRCSSVVVAAGAWSGDLLETLGVRIATPPNKGQIVLLRSDRRLLGRIVEHGKNYLVPRDDGRILVGATEADAGFDRMPTEAGYRALILEAHRLCPVLRQAEVEATWAGLRPGSIDARPYLGIAPGLANLVIAAGHNRAGLQLAPATAEVVVDLVLGRPPRIELRALAVDREPAGDADLAAFRS